MKRAQHIAFASIFALNFYSDSTAIAQTLPASVAASQEVGDLNNKFSIKSVSLGEVKVDPPIPFYKSLGQSSFGLGLVGHLATKSSGEQAQNELHKILLDNQIEVKEIVRLELIEQIKAKRIFSEVGSSEPDGIINLEIRRYGLFKTSVFSLSVRPVLWLRASLVKKDGSEIWSGKYTAPTYDSQLPSGTLEFFQQNPDSLKEGFQKHAKEAVTDLIDDLKK